MLTRCFNAPGLFPRPLVSYSHLFGVRPWCTRLRDLSGRPLPETFSYGQRCLRSIFEDTSKLHRSPSLPTTVAFLPGFAGDDAGHAVFLWLLAGPGSTGYAGFTLHLALRSPGCRPVPRSSSTWSQLVLLVSTPSRCFLLFVVRRKILNIWSLWTRRTVSVAALVVDSGSLCTRLVLLVRCIMRCLLLCRRLWRLHRCTSSVW